MGLKTNGKLPALAIVSLFALVFLGPTMAHALRIFFDSEGYPMYFFNVDNAWTLQYVHTLNQGIEYPPRNISANLPGFNYQYGVVFLAYLLNRLPFLSAYQATLVVLPIAMYSMLLVVLVKTARSIHDRSDSYFLLILFTLMFVRNGEYDPSRPVEGFERLTLVEANIFRLSQFMQLQALSGYLLLALLIHAVYFKKSFLLSRSCFFLIVLFKAAFFPMALAILGVETLQELQKRQRTLFSFDILLIASTFLVLKMFVKPSEHFDELTTFFGFKNSGPWFRIQPFGVIDHVSLLRYLLLALPLIILRPSLRGDGRGEGMRKMSFVLLINLCVFSIIYVDTPNRVQFTNPIGLLIVFMNASAMAGFRVGKNLVVSAILAAHLFFFGFSNVIGGLKIAVETAIDPSRGHEYAYNRPLAEVLGHLKVSDRQVLATNDLRYPANGFNRTNRQFQMSSLFGHTFFNAELFNGFIYFKGDTAARRREFKVREEVKFRLSDPTKDLISEAASLRSLGITHVILHVKHPHIGYSGCTVLKENNDYVLLSLSEASANGSPQDETSNRPFPIGHASRRTSELAESGAVLWMSFLRTCRLPCWPRGIRGSDGRC